MINENLIDPNELEDGGIWPLDKATAEFIANNGKSVTNGHRWDLEECPYCKGQYIKILGHSCESVIHIRMEYGRGADGKYYKIDWGDEDEG